MVHVDATLLALSAKPMDADACTIVPSVELGNEAVLNGLICPMGRSKGPLTIDDAREIVFVDAPSGRKWSATMHYGTIGMPTTSHNNQMGWDSNIRRWKAPES